MEENNAGTPIKVNVPETHHMAPKILFVMFVVLGCLLVVLFITDRGKEEAIRKYEALVSGVQATMPLQAYLMQYHGEHQNWPDGASALQAVSLDLPQSVRGIAVAEDGTITLTYTEVVHDGGKMHLKPRVDGSGRIMWTCLGEALPEKVLPVECSLIKN